MTYRQLQLRSASVSIDDRSCDTWRDHASTWPAPDNIRGGDELANAEFAFCDWKDGKRREVGLVAWWWFWKFRAWNSKESDLYTFLAGSILLSFSFLKRFLIFSLRNRENSWSNRDNVSKASQIYATQCSLFEFHARNFQYHLVILIRHSTRIPVHFFYLLLFFMRWWAEWMYTDHVIRNGWSDRLWGYLCGLMMFWSR